MGRSASDWPVQNQLLPLAPGDVHLWLAALNGSPSGIDRYAALLSRDERERAARFLQPSDRDRFVVARGFLRTLLGAYTDAAPPDVRFEYNPQGKPALYNGANAHQIQFNLSHSDNWALLAITRNRPVGVDLERVATDCDFRALARRFLLPSERADFDKLSSDELPDAWFRLWTIKEAYAKAIGTGLTGPLDALQIPTATETQWKSKTLVPCSGYVAAVVAQGEITNLLCRRWTKPRPDLSEKATSPNKRCGA